MRLSKRIIRDIENTPIRDSSGRILGPKSYKLAKQVERLLAKVAALEGKRKDE